MERRLHCQRLGSVFGPQGPSLSYGWTGRIIAAQPIGVKRPVLRPLSRTGAGYAATAAVPRFRRQPMKPMPASAEAKSGSAAGIGVVAIALVA